MEFHTSIVEALTREKDKQINNFIAELSEHLGLRFEQYQEKLSVIRRPNSEIVLYEGGPVFMIESPTLKWSDDGLKVRCEFKVWQQMPLLERIKNDF
jgi:hypothetical protein